MKKKRTLGLVAFVVFCFALFYAPVVSAASCGGVETALVDCGSTESGIGHILSLVINIMSVIIGIVGAIGIAIAGVQYLSAKDSEDKVRKAKRRIFEIVIGLAAYVLLAGIAQWLLPGGSLNPSTLPYYEMPDQGGNNDGGNNGNNNDNSDDGTIKISGGELIVKIANWAAWQNGEYNSFPDSYDWYNRVTPYFRNILRTFWGYVPSATTHDCGYFVASVVRYANKYGGLTLDGSFPEGTASSIGSHLYYHTDYWEPIPNYGNTSNLKAGDIFVADGHTFIYIGNDRIAEANLSPVCDTGEYNCGLPPHTGSFANVQYKSVYKIYRYKKEVTVNLEEVCCGADGKYCKSGAEDQMVYDKSARTCKKK